ncbi:MAG: hypothetical protein IPM54_20230 [Polyangiaceae bacterium]|nr:hypothetical protein [Polyangiaceae bacterium]
MKCHALLVGIGFSLLAAVSLSTAACVDADELGNDELDGEGLTAEAVNALTHGCTLGVDCHLDGSGTVTNIVTGTAATYRVKMTGYRRMDVFADVCNPTGWWLHVGDSPTNDGWGGDSAKTDHDAEVHMNGNGLSSYSSYDMVRGEAGAATRAWNVYPGGCKTVKMTVYHASGSTNSMFRFFSDKANTTPSFEIESLHGFKIGYSACSSSTSTSRSIECDWEDKVLADKDYWYVGVNRSIGSASRTGSGVSRACIVLNSDINTNPTSCLPSPPSPPSGYCGDGVCNNGETSASCPGDCPPPTCLPLTGDPKLDSLIENPCLE